MKLDAVLESGLCGWFGWSFGFLGSGIGGYFGFGIGFGLDGGLGLVLEE